MTKDEYIDYIAEDIATEGIKDILSSPDFANKLIRSAGSVFLDLLDSIAANIIVLSNNLNGYVIYKESSDVMELVIEKFDKMIDDCTYNIDKLLQGFSQKDIEKGIEIFEAKTLTQKTAARVAISEALKAIDAFHKKIDNDPESNQGPRPMNKFTESTRLQRKMLALQRKISGLSKKINLSLRNIATLEKYGISKEYAEEMLSVNRSELAKMGSVLISAFSIVYVKPDPNYKSKLATQVQPDKDLTKATQMMNVVN